MIMAPFLKSVTLQGAPTEQAYPFSTALARKGFTINFDRPVTIITGENGAGKSTLVESIALHCGFAATGGNRNHNLGQPASDVAPLQEHLKFGWSVRVTNGFFMRAESFFNFSSYIDELARAAGKKALRPYGGKSLHAQSHGEAFLSLFSNRMNAKGIYILDEPEAALSPQRQLALLAIINELEKTGQAQFFVATHSPLLMAYPNAQLLHIDDGEIVEKNYKATTHFQVMARFFANPDDYIRAFLRQD